MNPKFEDLAFDIDLSEVLELKTMRKKSLILATLWGSSQIGALYESKV